MGEGRPGRDGGTGRPSSCPGLPDCDGYLTAGEREDQLFEQAYRLGFAAGVEVGRGQAEYEMTAGAEWRTGRPVGTGPTRAELEERRRHSHAPCERRCGRCSTCIYAAAYARRGEYVGAPISREQLRRRLGIIDGGERGQSEASDGSEDSTVAG